MKNRLEHFIRKEIVKHSASTDSPEESLKRKEALFETLMIVDRELPWQEFYREHGNELFSLCFKLTFYGQDIMYSDKNDHEVIDDHDNLCWLITQIKLLESQINFVIENLL